MAEPAHRLRRGTADDTRRAFDLFVTAVRDLTARSGIPWEPDVEAMYLRLTPLLDFLAEHAAEWWIAEDAVSGEIIGHARSIQRGGLFELTEYFVDPARQSAGVGTALLERAFPADRGELRVIIATTDVRAQARYYRMGTVARFPIVALGREPELLDVRTELEVEPIGPERIGDVAAIETAVLGYERGHEYGWLLGLREGYLYRRDGRPVGFAFLTPTGTGPIAALDPTDQTPILVHLERRAAELGIPHLSFEVPMVNGIAMRHLLDRGFRLDPFYTFLMSSREFGSFDRFIGYAPPFFL